MNNISLLTYTHTNVKDAHEAYFKRIEKYFPSLKNNYVTCNENIDYANCIVYNDSDKHSKQMIDALNQIPTEYVIYAQEDYILFDYVKEDELAELVNVMEENSEIPFIRLLQSGLGNPTEKFNDKLAFIDFNSDYYFSTQITLWRKSILIEMYKRADVQKLTDTEVHKVQHLRDISTKGLFTLQRGNQVGGHFNSYHYPYIATGIVKGKWNYSEYEKELRQVFDEFKIVPFERGIV